MMSSLVPVVTVGTPWLILVDEVASFHGRLTISDMATVLRDPTTDITCYKITNTDIAQLGIAQFIER
jgi:hypothetical protein